MTDQSVRPRVYIKNLNYYTSEEELEQLFREFEPVNVLIPSYTYRFGKISKYRPFGIAYAEFKGDEQVDKVIAQFDGITFKERTLSVRKHVPFDPERHFLLRRFSITHSGSHGIDVVSPVEDKSADSELPAEVKVVDEKEHTVSEHHEPTPPETKKDNVLGKDISDDTIYISKVHQKVSEAEIKGYFEKFSPTKVYIYREKRSRRGSISFKNAFVTVLVTVDTSSASLQEIIDEARKGGLRKLLGRRGIVRPALKSKIDEVSKEVFKQSETVENDVASSKNIGLQEPISEKAEELVDETNVDAVAQAQDHDEVSVVASKVPKSEVEVEAEAVSA
ncbi:uncharacterized protein RJT20DRAFT_147536 [Scheffersomyces xylosifermentans]|uniref:uncharacterized protein n=1 Tax=Scheffersomyces xylosifermentans TaxID=1304137 RepID=UPI00315DBA8B